MAGASGGHSYLMQGFGGLPQRTAESASFSQLQPLLRGLGAGIGKKWDAYNAKIGEGGGPLSGAIRDIQGFAPTVMPQAEALGSRVASEAPAQYELFKNQLSRSLQSGNQTSAFLQGLQDPTMQGITNAQSNIDYAGQALQDAFSPVNQSAMYQQATNRMLPELQSGLAARGMLESGAGGAAEGEMLRDLSFQFAQNQAQQQQSALGGANQALGGLQGLTGTGVNLGQAMGQQNLNQAQLGGMGMEGLGQFANMMQQSFGIPMAAAGSLLSLLTAGLSPGINLTQATAPVGGQEQKSTSVL